MIINFNKNFFIIYIYLKYKFYSGFFLFSILKNYDSNYLKLFFKNFYHYNLNFNFLKKNFLKKIFFNYKYNLNLNYNYILNFYFNLSLTVNKLIILKKNILIKVFIFKYFFLNFKNINDTLINSNFKHLKFFKTLNLIIKNLFNYFKKILKHLKF